MREIRRAVKKLPFQGRGLNPEGAGDRPRTTDATVDGKKKEAFGSAGAWAFFQLPLAVRSRAFRLRRAYLGLLLFDIWGHDGRRHNCHIRGLDL